MNIYKLKYFYDSVALGSVTKAAEKNFITQSAVSQAIRSIEEDIGAKLVLHRKNSFELTAEGVVVYESCQKVFNEIDNLKTNAINTRAKVHGTLNVASTNSIGQTFLVEKISKFSKKYPDLKIILKLGNSEQVKNMLLSKEAEVGFILEEDGLEGFDRKIIKEGRFELISKSPEKIINCCDQLLITRENKIEVKDLVEKMKAELKVEQLDFKMQMFSWEIIKKLVLDEVGVGYVPDYLITQEIKTKKLHRVKVKFECFQYKLLCIHMKNRSLSYNSQKFMELF